MLSLLCYSILSLVPSQAGQSPDPLTLVQIMDRFENGGAVDLPDTRALVEKGLQLASAEANGEAQGILRLELGVALMDNWEFESALPELAAALELNREYSPPLVLIRNLNTLGICNQRQNHGDRARELFEESLSVSVASGDRKSEGRALSNLGLSYKFRGEFESAVEYFSASLLIAEELQDEGLSAVLLNNLGNVYSATGDLEQALVLLRKSLEIKERLGDPKAYKTTMNVGIALGRQYKDAEALEYYDRALVGATEEDDRRQLVNLSMNSGVSHLRLGHLEEARPRLEAAVEGMRELSSARDLSSALLALGLVYSELDREEDSLRVLTEGRQLADESSAADLEGEVLLALSEANAALGRYQRAFEQVREHILSTDRSQQKDANASLARYRAEFEAREKEAQIHHLEHENEVSTLELQRAQLIRNVGLGGLLALGVVVAALVRLYRSRGHAQEAVEVANAQLSQTNLQLADHRDQLQVALDEVESLRGLLSICSHCKSICNEEGHWEKVERFIQDRTEAQFSHGICPACLMENYNRLPAVPLV